MILREAFRIAVVIAAACVGSAAGHAQVETIDPGIVSGTLARIKTTGTVRLGYRDASIPFSYLDRSGRPIGYSIDICNAIVEEIGRLLDREDLKVDFVKVTSETRLQAIVGGEIDLECGSTTNNVQRQKEVAFSPIFFVAGTKLMVPKSSSIRSYRDLADRTVVVTAGTTNEAALRTLSDKQKLKIHIVTARDHAQSLQMLVSGGADAFATDDVLLYGFIATAPSAHDMMVVGDYLSYDPYGLVYRRDDPQFTSIVERSFARMASERRLTELYNKWFLRRLPTGETLNLPMSPQLEEIFRVLGQSD